MLIGIPSDRLPKLWQYCAPLIDKAIQSIDSDYDIENVHERAIKRECQIWAWIEQDKIIACFVTEIIIRPKRKILTVPLIGGSGLKVWRHGVDDTLADYGRAHGCEYMEGYARPGWLRVLKNWFTLATIIRRKI